MAAAFSVVGAGVEAHGLLDQGAWVLSLSDSLAAGPGSSPLTCLTLSPSVFGGVKQANIRQELCTHVLGVHRAVRQVRVSFKREG